MVSTAINLGAQCVAIKRGRDEARKQRARQITAEAGHALEILGHAIEYLTDEYMFETKELTAGDPQMGAIRLLMDLNRQIYFDCPVVPTFGERVRAFFRADRG